MIIFLLMVAIATVVTARSIVRLLHTRFLKPLDLAIVSTYYYAVPLAIAGFFIYNPRSIVFLHTQAADPAIAFQSMKYALAAIASLVLGSWVGKAVGKPVLGTYFPVDESSEMRARYAFMGLVTLVALGIYQFGLTEFFNGYATSSDLDGAATGTALVYFGVASFGLVIAYGMLIQRANRSRSLLILMFLSFLIALAVLIIRAKRLEIVITLLPAIIILLAGRSSLKITAGRLAIGLVAGISLVAIAVIRIDDTFEIFTLNFYTLSEGLYAGHALPGIINRLDVGMVGYENGGRFLNALLGFVPRFIWPSKDEIVYAGDLAMEGVTPLGATTFLAEVVLQGGLIAVVMVHFILGLIFERVTRFEDVWDKAIESGKVPGRFIAYIVLTAVFIPHFRDGIIPAVKLSLQALAFFVVLVGISRTPQIITQMRQKSLNWTPAPR